MSDGFRVPFIFANQVITYALMFPLWLWLTITKNRDTHGRLMCDTLVDWSLEHPWRKWYQK